MSYHQKRRNCCLFIQQKSWIEFESVDIPIQRLKFIGNRLVARKFEEILAFGNTKFDPVVVVALNSRFATPLNYNFEDV